MITPALVLFAVPFVLSAGLWWAAPAVARACSPRAATTALTVTALIAALSTGLVLCVVATLTVVEIPALARTGHWSAQLLLHRAPIPAPVGIACGVLAATLLALSARQLLRAANALTAAARACRSLGPGASGLVIVADEHAFAYAVPGIRGRTVISQSLLRALDPFERRAVLAHEQAHLRHRHVLYVQLCELAAAANPMLRPAARTVRFTVEAWADEDAARTVGDRRTVARALAKAGLLHPRSPGPALLSIAHSDVSARIRVLLAPPRSATPGRIALAALVMATLIGGSAAATAAFGAHTDFESAQAGYEASP